MTQSLLFLTALLLAPLVVSAQTERKGSLPETRPDDSNAEGYFLRFAGAHFIELADTARIAEWDHEMTIEMWFRVRQEQRRTESADEKSMAQLFGTKINLPRNAMPPEHAYWYVHLASERDKSSVWLSQNDFGMGQSFSDPDVSTWVHAALHVKPKGAVTLSFNGKSGLPMKWADYARLRSGRLPGYNLCLGGIAHREKPARFHGDIRAFRISRTKRYETPFDPPDNFESDKDTVVLLDFSRPTANVILDQSAGLHHGVISGATWFSLADEQAAKPIQIDTRSIWTPKKRTPKKPVKPGSAPDK